MAASDKNKKIKKNPKKGLTKEKGRAIMFE